MAEYRFLTTWIVDAEIDPVWEAIHDVVRWSEWWRGVRPVFEWNHRAVMRRGGEGLAERLGASLLARS